jgi:hypothetical protein
MVEELKIIISATTEKLNSSVKQAKDEINSFKDQVSQASGEVDGKLRGLGDALNAGWKTAATTIAGVGTAILALGPATQEYRNEQAKLQTAFEAAGSSAAVATDTYNALYRVMGESDTAVEAAGHLAQLTTNEQDLAEWTTICQGVYATFGDSLPIESLTEAANETAKTGELTGALADALNWAGVSEDEFKASLEACNTEAEREALIRETLMGLYEESAAVYEENNAAVLAQNEANAELQASLAALGEAVAPVVTAFTQFASDALAIVIPYIQQLAEQYGPALASALDTVAAALGTAFGFLTEHMGLLATVAGVIAGITAAVGLYNAVAAVKAAMDAAQVTTLGALVAAYAAQAAAMVVAIAPYALIVAAIAAVIAIIVLCIKHWDDIKAAVGAAWDWICEKTSAAVDAVTGFFSGMKDKVVEKVEEMKEKAQEKLSDIKEKFSEIGENIKETASEKFEGAKEKITDAIDKAKEHTQGRLEDIKSAYDEHGGGIKGIAAAYMEAVRGHYQTKYDAINQLTNGKLGEVVDKVKTKMSQANDRAKESLEKIKENFNNIFEKAKEIVSKAVEKCKSLMNFTWSLPKLKLPTIHISGSFSLNPLRVPSFSISWNKLGGVFDSPTIFPYGNTLQGLGEDGAEAIVPLEKNTEWLDRIAEILNEKQGSQPIVLQVDGKTFAQISVDSINQLTRQRGSLALNLL